MPSRRSDVVAFRSGLLYEADIVADALSEAGIPFYRRTEVLGGPEFAMPVAASPGPGTVWSVLVPEMSRASASELIESLPVSNVASPGSWSFHPKPWARTLIVVAASLVLAAYAFWGLVGGVSAIKWLFK
jgi:hypothetical protein